MLYLLVIRLLIWLSTWTLAVDTPVFDPAVHVAPAVVDSTPIATVIGGKKSLPAEPSGKPAPAVRFFDPRSSTAKKERLQLLESRQLFLNE